MSTEETNNQEPEQDELGLAVGPSGNLKHVTKASIKESLNPKMREEAKRMTKMQEQIDRGGFTITQVAEVISHTLIEAIEIFNQESKNRFADNMAECPEFRLAVVPVMLSPEHFRDTGVESRAVFTLELLQFGSSSVIYRDGIEFTCERDRKNVNAWLPKIYQRFFQYIVNTSMFYSMALNPDNPNFKKD